MAAEGAAENSTRLQRRTCGAEDDGGDVGAAIALGLAVVAAAGISGPFGAHAAAAQIATAMASTEATRSVGGCKAAMRLISQ
jgi:hypothetical protein